MRKVPKLRFKEFSDEWEEKKLGDILEFKNGVNASKEQYGKGIKFINVLDILNNDFITYDNIIGKVDIDNNTVEKYSVTYGDILFQRSSETREEVGMANVYLSNVSVKKIYSLKSSFIFAFIPPKETSQFNPPN
ncbi:restriction endonuclease subunit S, partial [Fusobacterium mortiferum]